MDSKVFYKIVPELNFWFNRISFNNTFNRTNVSCPTKISEFWRCKDSVVELIFNETADPSGKTYDDGYHFIWKYRTVNLKNLWYYEPMIYKRIEVCRNCCWVYAAKDDEKFIDVFNLYDKDLTVGVSDYDYPYGIKPTKYVTYNSHIVCTGTDPLYYDDDPISESESEEDPIIIPADENVFGLMEEELKMCEYLYYYRTGQYELIEEFDEDFFYTLKSPLSKWVYIYLMCYMFNRVNEDWLQTLTMKEDGCFRSMCEKHLQDRVYEYIQRQFMTLWEKINNLGGVQDQRTFETRTEPCFTCLVKNRVTEDDINAKCIVITDRQPYFNMSFEFIYDGVKLKQNVDYVLKNTNNYSDPRVIVELTGKNWKVESGNKYQLMYNYVVPCSPFSGVKQLDNR